MQEIIQDRNYFIESNYLRIQNYSDELEAGSVHAYKLILGLVRVGEL